MTTPIAVPLIQGVYRISSAAGVFPELYLDLQSDGDLKASRLNTSSDCQMVWYLLYLPVLSNSISFFLF
jgi:hypothetical protein